MRRSVREGRTDAMPATTAAVSDEWVWVGAASYKRQKDALEKQIRSQEAELEQQRQALQETRDAVTQLEQVGRQAGRQTGRRWRSGPC